MSTATAQFLLDKLAKIDRRWDVAIWSPRYEEPDDEDTEPGIGYRWADAWRNAYGVMERELFRLPGAAEFFAAKGASAAPDVFLQTGWMIGTPTTTKSDGQSVLRPPTRVPPQHTRRGSRK
jgi:hypothetical protein